MALVALSKLIERSFAVRSDLNQGFSHGFCLLDHLLRKSDRRAWVVGTRRMLRRQDDDDAFAAFVVEPDETPAVLP